MYCCLYIPYTLITEEREVASKYSFYIKHVTGNNLLYVIHMSVKELPNSENTALTRTETTNFEASG